MNCSRRFSPLWNRRVTPIPLGGMIEVVVHLGKSSPYKMTHRFLKGTATWESWFYKRVPNVKWNHDFQVKSLLRLLHWMHCVGIQFKPFLWYDCYYRTREVAEYALRKCNITYRAPQAKPAPRNPPRAMPRMRDLRREAEYTPRPKAPQREASPPPDRRVRSHKELVGSVCPKCKSPRVLTSIPKFMYHADASYIPDSLRNKLFPYYWCWLDAQSGRMDGRALRDAHGEMATLHRIRVATRAFNKAHPLSCLCKTGNLASRRPGLKLSLG
jgi:hypothetical protein